MSSPEERRRAVELYSATPMTTAQMVRHLGYPTDSAWNAGWCM
ncbi:IS3 family transposase [Bifidobacterium porcinum]|nr:IS3 family transposase [Bifidobacterium porcinum]